LQDKNFKKASQHAATGIKSVPLIGCSTLKVNPVVTLYELPGFFLMQVIRGWPVSSACLPCRSTWRVPRRSIHWRAKPSAFKIPRIRLHQASPRGRQSTWQRVSDSS